MWFLYQRASLYASRASCRVWAASSNVRGWRLRSERRELIPHSWCWEQERGAHAEEIETEEEEQAAAGRKELITHEHGRQESAVSWRVKLWSKRTICCWREELEKRYLISRGREASKLWMWDLHIEECWLKYIVCTKCYSSGWMDRRDRWIRNCTYKEI